MENLEYCIQYTHVCNRISTFSDKLILKIYESAPHGLTYTHKDKVNDDLLEFIKS